MHDSAIKSRSHHIETPVGAEIDIADRRDIPPEIAHSRLLLAGCGAIGSHAAPALAKLGVGHLRLVDRDVVEAHNTANQAFVSQDIGRPKVEVVAERLRAINPRMTVETLHADLEDLPTGWFADVDLCLAGLDSLRARQILANERAWPLGKVVIDGGVGGTIGSVKTLVPGGACIECGWGTAHYRQIGRETPCDPRVGATSAPTRAAPGVGAAVATLMADEALRQLAGEPRRDSHEWTFDVRQGRRLASRLVRAARCRHDHVLVARRVELPIPFAAATLRDVLELVSSLTGGAENAAQARLEFRRGLFARGLFGQDRWLAICQLAPYSRRRLSQLGLTRLDRIRVRMADGDAFVMWE